MNTLKRNDYYSQNNNRFRPMGACNWTSVIMAACQSGIKESELKQRVKYWNNKYNWNYTQPEDSGMIFTQQNKYRDIARGSFPQSDIYPEQSWNAICDAFNDWIGESLAYILWAQTLSQISKKLASGFGVVMCGNFPKTAGHFVNIGWINENSVTINDPHGDPLTEYESEDGYNIHFPINDFRDIMQGSGGTFRVLYVRPRE